jgi:hypothetical protein
VSELAAALARIGNDLDTQGRPWALVGAIAVAAHAEARATLDVEVAVGVADPTDAAGLVAALRSRGYVWQADFGVAMTRLAVPDAPAAGLRLDLLFGFSGIEREVARDACRLAVVADLWLPVALRGDLIALELLAAAEPTREHDYRDLRALLRGASAEDLQRAYLARPARCTGGSAGRQARGRARPPARPAGLMTLPPAPPLAFRWEGR